MAEKRDISLEIEQLVDETSLLHVLTALECICGEKAEHIRSNWQDKALAKHWDKASRIIGKALRQEPIVTRL